MVAKAKAGALNLARTVWGLRQTAPSGSRRGFSHPGSPSCTMDWVDYKTRVILAANFHVALAGMEAAQRRPKGNLYGSRKRTVMHDFWLGRPGRLRR
jgi:hypothetical protein